MFFHRVEDFYFHLTNIMNMYALIGVNADIHGNGLLRHISNSAVHYKLSLHRYDGDSD